MTNEVIKVSLLFMDHHGRFKFEVTNDGKVYFAEREPIKPIEVELS